MGFDAHWFYALVVPHGFCTLFGRAYAGSALRLRLLALGSVGPYQSGLAFIGYTLRSCLVGCALV